AAVAEGPLPGQPTRHRCIASRILCEPHGDGDRIQKRLMDGLRSRRGLPVFLCAMIGALYAICLVWTHPKLEYDAMNFWTYAQTFHRDGIWKAIAQSAPSREPGYPFFLFTVSSLVA